MNKVQGYEGEDEEIKNFLKGTNNLSEKWK